MLLSPGTRLGAYEILAPLGKGGMAEVYRARDTRLPRTVAIKVQRRDAPVGSDDDFRFRREAEVIAGLNHPHICALYDIGQADGRDYLVMEYVEGETLAHRLTQNGRLPLLDALRYADQIAEALAVAHAAGVVHRDLKPANVMLTSRGIKLLDFGVAKRTLAFAPSPDGSHAGTLPATAVGAVVGTLNYMAPEQLEGRAVDARADIFAFGAVLYEMLTGHRAFDGSSQASVIGAILLREPPPLEAGGETPVWLSAVVNRCLRKSPEDRWGDGAALREALRSTSGDGVVPSVEAGATLASKPRKRRLVISFTFSIGFAVVLLAVFLRQPATSPPMAQATGDVVVPDNGQAPPGAAATTSIPPASAPAMPAPIATDTPALPPLIVEEFAKLRIRALLTDWCAAYEQIDADAVQRTYPTVDMATLRLQLSSERVASVQCSLSEPVYQSLDLVRGRAKVQLTVKRVYQHIELQRRKETSELIATLVLVRPGERSQWRIESATYRAK